MVNRNRASLRVDQGSLIASPIPHSPPVLISIRAHRGMLGLTVVERARAIRGGPGWP